MLRRFLAEAQVTSQLQHPNIVPVYDVDRRAVAGQNQQPFYTMKLVQGRTLGDAIAEYHQHRRAGKLDVLEQAKLLQAFVSVCQAMAYAHSRHVIHRDLKPGNIVLGDFGEVIVLDWGEAKVLSRPGQSGEPEGVSPRTSDDANSSDEIVQGLTPAGSPEQVTPEQFTQVQFTQEAEPIELTQGWKGTPGYMAPEQAASRHDQVDHRTDIYGLGAILFNILTGRSPHRVQPGEKLANTAEITAFMDRIIQHPTPRIRAVDASLPVSLDAVCAKAMASQREDRYQTAAELANEIQRYLADEPVAVLREPVTVRIRRWMKRHQVAVATTAAAGLMAVIGLAVLAGVTSKHNRDLTDANEKKDEQTKLAIKRGDDLTKANQEKDEQTKLAEQRRKDTEANLELADRRLYDADMSLVQMNWEASLVRPVLDRLKHHLPRSNAKPNDEDRRGFSGSIGTGSVAVICSR